MITRNTLKNIGTPKQRKAALELVEKGAVCEFELLTEEEYDMSHRYYNYYEYDYVITGTVETEHYIYSTTIFINEENNRLCAYACECQYSYRREAFCEHCLAVLIEYIKRKESGEIKITRKSTRGLSNVLQKYTSKGLAEIAVTSQISEIEEKRVKIEAEFELESDYSYDNQLRLSFKVGNQRMYVIKNVSEFLRAIDRGENISYGKSLKFIHTEEAFDEEALKWIRIMRDNSMNHGPYYDYEAIRYISLKGIRLDYVMQNCVAEQVNFKWEGEKKATPMQIHQGQPELNFMLHEDSDGLLVKYQPFYLIEGDRYQYFMVQNGIYVMSKESMHKIGAFLKFLSKQEQEEIFIGRQDLPTFAEEIYPFLQEIFPTNKSNFVPAACLPEKPTYEFHLSMPQQDVVYCVIEAKYHERIYNIYDKDTEQEFRNLKDELKVKYAVSEYFNAFHQQENALVVFEDEALLYALLTEGTKAMDALGTVYISKELQKLRVKPSARIEIGVSLSGGLLELDVKSNELSYEDLAYILSKYKTKQKYFRLKNGDFIPMEETAVDVLMELQEATKFSIKDMKEGHIAIPAYRALYLDQLLKENREEITSIRDRGFKEVIRNMKTIEDSAYEVPETIQGVLRPYQKNGFRWIKTMKKHHFGCILADDMGLGKTLQAITFLLSEVEHQKQETLIVCPASLVYNWENEIHKFAPNLSVQVVVGNAEQRSLWIQESLPGRILITSYDLLRRDIDSYKDKKFDIQIIDEAQYIKNHGTQMAKAVKIIRAEFKMAMTGTPIENRLSELWSIFDYLMPGFLYQYQQFRKSYEMPIVNNQDENALSNLQRMITPFILRRTKKKVLKDLPDKVEEIVTTKMQGEQADLYQAHAQRLKMVLEKQTDEEYQTGKIEVLAEITKLRQLCCHPSLLYQDFKEESAKLELCMHYIKNAVEGGHKILLFSQFTSMFPLIEQELAKEDISYFVLTGSTSKEKRRDMVNQFNQDDTSVFCISLKAGGTGLNLTAADIVIHYDPWWNVAVETQASDRAHRIGQKQTVNVYKLVVEETIEEKIVKLQEKKQKLAEQLLSGESIASTTFTREDLLEIL